MSDWNDPTVDSTYTEVIAEVKGRDDDAVRLNDSRATDATNLPTYAKRWNNTLAVFQAWVSSAWGTLVLAIGGGGTGATTAFGARTNLGVMSSSEVASAIDADVATHNSVTNPHSAVSAATASRLILRDTAGRAQVTSPSASADIATKGYTDGAIDADVATHSALQSAGIHGGTSAATASKLVQRDTSGRAQVTSPSASADIATKGYVDGLIISGSYTPIAYLDQNVSAATPYKAFYIKIGSIVHVSGSIYADPTATGAICVVGLSLPIASDLASNFDLAGVCGGPYGDGEAGMVYGNATSNRARVDFYAQYATNHQINYTYTYQVL